MKPGQTHDPKLKSFWLDDQKTAHVCAWCFPLDTIFEKFPHLRGKVAISHGICKEHLAKIILEIKANKP
jgi:hypothetical protein